VARAVWCWVLTPRVNRLCVMCGAGASAAHVKGGHLGVQVLQP